MCVNHTRPALLSRAGFMAAAGAAAAPVFLRETAAANPQPPAMRLPPGLSSANARAAKIAFESPLVRRNLAAAYDLCGSIGNARLRSDVEALLNGRSPLYAQKYRTQESRVALRDALAREDFVKPDAPVTGIFPPGLDGSETVQPFWSAPGSAVDSHHSYPGGLLAHELFNSRMAANFEQTYDALYFDRRAMLDRDMVVAAAFYHDIMKTVVFQYNDDGSLLAESDIAGTGAHHCLSGAEAIARGHDARFVTVLLSAHAAPSLGDEAKVVNWCRASAIVAGVDAVEYGLVKQTAEGYALAQPAPIEAFVNHLSDHDYVLTIPAVREVVPQLQKINRSPWFRHEVLARTSAVALYEQLTRSEEAFRQAVRAAVG
jgi:hypothetical protein